MSEQLENLKAQMHDLISEIPQVERSQKSLHEGPGLVERLHQYRRALSVVTQPIRAEASLRHEKGGAEITLAWRALQQAKMWLGMALGENQVNPPWEKDGDN